MKSTKRTTTPPEGTDDEGDVVVTTKRHCRWQAERRGETKTTTKTKAHTSRRLSRYHSGSVTSSGCDDESSDRGGDTCSRGDYGDGRGKLKEGTNPTTTTKSSCLQDSKEMSEAATDRWKEEWQDGLGSRGGGKKEEKKNSFGCLPGGRYGDQRCLVASKGWVRQ